jgi:hypothetical protein
MKNSSPPPNIKGKKKQGTLSACLSPWLHQISLPKKLGHRFWPGLTPLAKNTLCWGTFDFKKLTARFFKHFRFKELPVWIYQNLKTIDRFRKRTGGYLTNSNSPTTKVESIRNRLLKLVASTLITIYEVINN